MRWPQVIILTAICFGAILAQASDDPAYLRGRALIDALRAGGYTIYFRHAATDWTQQDRVEQAGDWQSCDPTQVRQLNEAGRATARAIGGAIRALRVPVSRVLASPYCRTRETAELMGLGEVLSDEAVINMRVARFFGGRDAIIASARALLAMPVAAGGNTVVVAHGNVAREATPVYPDEGEGVVFQADGRGGFDVVGRIRPDEWSALAEID